MKNYYDEKNGYSETIQNGLIGARTFTQRFSEGKGTKKEKIEMLKNQLKKSDAIVIGAGAGLSTSAGFTYSGERFEKYFFDFAEKYGIRDMCLSSH